MSSIPPTSTSTSTSMNCSSCGTITSIHNLVRVYANTWKDSCGSCCGRCLVGYHIPALRSNGKWEFGTVQTYDLTMQMYLMLFMDDEQEWVYVSHDPFEEYAQQFEDQLDSSEKSLEAFDEKCVPLFMTNSVDGSQMGVFSIDPIFNELILSPLQQPPLSPIMTASDFHSVEALSIAAKSPRDHLKKKARVDFPPDRSYHSPITRRSPKGRVVGCGSPTSQISTMSTSSTNTGGSLGSLSSRNPKLWMPEEDQLLLDKIAANNYELCWPKIAQEVPGRTGKQCRERYLNHLSSKLKKSGWTASEDAFIFRMYDLKGSKWSVMAKVLSGRSDNGIKNRYHHLRRRFEKRMQSIPDSKELGQLMKKIGESPTFRRVSLDLLVVRDIATRMLDISTKRQNSNGGDSEYKFGPFHQVENSLSCERCALVIPSKETGRFVCSRTWWCQTCTGVTLIRSGDLLRVPHLLKC